MVHVATKLEFDVVVRSLELTLFIALCDLWFNCCNTQTVRFDTGI